MNILEIVESELYRLMEIEQHNYTDSKPSYCAFCRHDRNYQCFAESPMQCPSVKAASNAIEGYLWGLRELKETNWLMT